MTGKAFDIRLIPKFSGAATDMPVVEWIENVELVCELCAMDRVEYVLTLHPRGGALAVYRQMSQKRADSEEINKAHMTAYATDAFSAFNQFTARQLQQCETVDEFLADLYCLPRLVGEPLPERWLTFVFESGLSQRVRQLLRASSRMETITLKQLLTRARAVVTDDWGQEEPIVAAVQASWSNIKAPPKLGPYNSIVCYKCNAQGTKWEIVRAEGKECMYAVTVETKQDIWRCRSSESTLMRLHAQLSDHSKCGTLPGLKEEGHQSDHYKRWNVKVSRNRDSKGPHRHWEFRWRWSASST